MISIDCGAIVDGWHGDAAITVAIGEVPADVAELMRVTEESLWAGIAAARLGGRVTDISHAVETSVRSQGDYGILEDYVGHGIGTQMHLPPNVPNVGRPGRGPKLVPGLALAVEPMVTLGTKETEVLPDVASGAGSAASNCRAVVGPRPGKRRPLTPTFTPDSCSSARGAGRSGKQQAREARHRRHPRSGRLCREANKLASCEHQRRFQSCFCKGVIRDGTCQTQQAAPGAKGS